MKNPRVFIGLREVAGYFSNLKKGFEEIGVNCAFLNLGGNPFNYDLGKNPKWVTALNLVGEKVGTKFSKSFILRAIWLLIFQNIFGFFAFFIAIFRYDVFIFGSHSTFFFFIDYLILKLMRKKIICVYLGSDTRPIFLNGYAFTGKGNARIIRIITRLQKSIIKFSERLSDITINYPPTAQFHNKEFVSWFHIGIPSEFPKFKKKEIGNKKIRIIHCPSKAQPKGSKIFKKIIEELELKYEIDYIEASGVPHKEVIKLISSADLALDEVYSDSPMAVFATECASQRVPVVVGSYYGNEIELDHPKNILPPSAFVQPKDLKSNIEELILEKDKRKKLGDAAYGFVKKNWSKAEVAKRYIKLINNDYPSEWNYNPLRIKYLYGTGLSKEQLLINLKKFSKGKKGSNVFFLKDKPLINDEYLKIINEKK
ncbi:hypothetical protein N9D78_01625 [Flavobacteriales bacterium]|nr:hypothetical protein [Flavobacteriales bacterium]